VVIFQENASFDHYFGTYPRAANPPGEPQFHPARRTPQVNTIPPALMTANPNGANPQRLDRNDYPLCDNSHDYDPELREWDGGKMDRFVTESIDYERSDDTRSPATYGHVPAGVTGGVTASNCTTPLPGHAADQATNKEVMDYYDGNTVTALWNYAQHGVLYDNAFGATFGPSTPGAINLVSGRPVMSRCRPAQTTTTAAPTCTGSSTSGLTALRRRGCRRSSSATPTSVTGR
jgi:phospholipase C